MADIKYQRANIRFCFLLGKSAAETVAMLRTAYGEEALSQARIYEWFSRFKSGQMSIEDEPRPGRPSTSKTDENIEKIRVAIMFDRRRTIDELEEMTGISWSSCQRILTEDETCCSKIRSACAFLSAQNPCLAQSFLPISRPKHCDSFCC